MSLPDSRNVIGSGNTRLRHERALSRDSVWDRSSDVTVQYGSGSSPPLASPSKVQRTGTATGSVREPESEEHGTPLTTTASSRPTAFGGSPTFPETPTPPAKHRHLKSYENMLRAQHRQKEIANMAMKLAVDKNRL